MRTNFHTHSNYCDGKASISEMTNAAIHAGIIQLGFSSHAPIPFPVMWSLSGEEEMKQYAAEIFILKSKNVSEIELFTGIEADYIPGITKDFHLVKNEYSLDYVIGSVHLVKVNDEGEVWFIDGNRKFFDEGIQKHFGGNGKIAVRKYFRQLAEMIQSQEFDIIAHFDKIKMNNQNRFFHEEEVWYRNEVMNILDLLKKNDIILELNTRGFYQNKITGMYPSTWVIQQAAEMKIPVMINSDAHSPKELMMGFPEAESILRQCGYASKIVRKNNQWVETDL